MNVDRLVERARELSQDGWFHAPDEVRSLLAGLADAVETLQARYDEEYRWSTGWRDLAHRKEARVAALEAEIADLVTTYYPPDVIEERLRALLDGRVPSTGQETT